MIRSAADVGPDGLEATVDVCIVGSGAGGSVVAAGLAGDGARVLVLEAGPAVDRRDFTMHERDTMPRFYQEGAGRATKDLAISVLQGAVLGGGTTVNWTSCFRTPERILAHWRDVHGLTDLTSEALRPHFDAVEARLNIREWPESAANANNRVLLDGAKALGWEHGPMRRNVKGCANSGYCGMGCPVDGKQAMHLTYLADASAAGAVVQADARATRLDAVPGGWKVTGVVRPERGGSEVPLSVTARVVVVAGGAINSPALLLRSGLGAGLPALGRRTFLHPVVAVLGRYARDIHPWYGAPQSAHSHEHIDRGPGKMGFFLEAAPLHPMLAAVSLKSFGPEHADAMLGLRRTSALLALHVDGLLDEDVGGVVTVDGAGRPELDYPFRAALLEALRPAHEALVQVHLAAGAEVVATTHTDPLRIATEVELTRLQDRPYGPLEHSVFSAHQMGGCTLGTDPATSVVGMDHQVHGVDNLFVVDGSVLPTALGVNPSETIYGLSHRAVGFVRDALGGG